MSDTALIKRRFELFYYILSGRPIAPTRHASTPTQTPTTNQNDKEKAPAHVNQDPENDDIPPTQVTASVEQTDVQEAQLGLKQ
ncbi:hypothetical protein L916_01755 [Phytophthora nicotianae]|uniref:Uncharacterized protein n=1 Tax=Phytophthora nicotianae TaxID=4792 RepID=W2JQH4_PHYNI|nr:hypothetical protein L916_01755 [Phytophthora nicotianae]